MAAAGVTVIDQIRRELDQPIFDAASAAAADIVADRGDTVAAVLFYGSCLRLGTDEDKILDFYVLCDDLSQANDSWFLGLMNRMVPPNVYYREVDIDGRIVRSKYALMSLDGFSAAMRASRFNASFWARFAQPAALAYARNDAVRAQVDKALVDAVTTTAAKALPMCPPSFSADDLWARAFELTYRAELRAEDAAGKGREIFLEYADRYRAITLDVLKSMGAVGHDPVAGQYDCEIPGSRRSRAAFVWRLRMVYGKAVSLVRLMKAALTFSGGLDYLAWKIRRHSGVDIEVSPWQRRHPLIGGLWLYVQNRGGGGFR